MQFRRSSNLVLGEYKEKLTCDIVLISVLGLLIPRLNNDPERQA